MDNPCLEVKNLKKIYHDKTSETLALDNINFTIKDKEYISIIGPSGCGKSTILGIISNIIPKSGGKIIFNKENPTIGYMLQEDSLFPWKTILENCLLGLEITKRLNEKTKQRAIELLTTYGLKDFMNKYPSSLSGGMRQRASLIRTLVLDPDILLLDEPFSALDYQTRLTLSDEVYEIIKKEGKTAVMVTHDIAEAISMSDRIILLSKRPSYVKNIYNIDFKEKSIPTENRKKEEFASYYTNIWKELDHHV